MLSQKSHKTYQMIIQNVQGSTYEFVKSFSKYPVVAWLVSIKRSSRNLKFIVL